MTVKNISLSLKSFFARPFRAIMCITSVAIGTFSVLLLTVIGQLGQIAVDSEMKKSGLGGLLIHNAANNSMPQEAVKRVYMTAGIEETAPVAMNKVKIGEYDDFECVSWAIDGKAKDVIALEPIQGRFFSEAEFIGFNAVCMIDESVAGKLFGQEDAIGKRLSFKIGDKTACFTVIGVIKAGGGILQTFSSVLPNMVFIPLETYRQLTAITGFTQIAARLYPDASDGRVQEELKLRLSDIDQSITVENLTKQKDNLSRILTIITAILTGVGAISVLVSGIGIAVTLVMSVDERTREIGIKMALGAKKRQIVCEFMTESLMIMLLGFTAGAIPALILAQIAKNAYIPTQTIPIDSVVIILAMTLVLGVIAGAYPAYKAASLSPCKAISKN